jgi:non-canonical (house-cleaning) NTP pyrophosphatase
MEVNIGTGNSLKVEAVRAVFGAAFPEDDIEVIAIDVPSRVPAQRVMSIHRLIPITPLLRFFLDITAMDS